MNEFMNVGDTAQLWHRG